MTFCPIQMDIDQDDEENENKKIAAMCIMLVVQTYIELYYVKTPKRISILTGNQYTQEIMDSQNNDRTTRILRMPKETFLKLVLVFKTNGLLMDSRKGITVERQLMQFMHIAGGFTNEQVAERFQCSGKVKFITGETISVYFHKVLDALVSIAPTLIKRKEQDGIIPNEIAQESKFMPFFKDAIGALDGCHVPVAIPSKDAGKYRNRKGFLSQNVLGVCNFDLTFSYVVAGWEGSATDSRVLNETIGKNEFAIPQGKYYVADAGYGLSNAILTPYRGVRYHLKEWSKGTDKPMNAKELFNLRHAQLRNCIERIFGVVKKRFPILTRATENLSLQTQIELVFALFALHNFITVNQVRDDCIQEEFE
jgi:hypothetical protein